MEDLLARLWEIAGEFFGGLAGGIERSITGMFGSSNARYLKKLRPQVEAINALEPKYQALTDAELKEQTAKFRKRLASGETPEDLLMEAFAVCREAGRRVLGMRHYDVQLMGGIVLHRGSIAEMVTGEGKTLVATLPAYLNALEGKGVHVVTVNDYLARRDMEWMGPLYMSLGLTVGAIQSNMETAERQAAYDSDITYGTNNEFGFDYLRDNMRPAAKGDDRYPKHLQQVQGPLHFAIIDEVDNILIDEARTPLIISGPAHDDVTRYSKADRIARQLKKGSHFEVNEKEHSAHLTDDGVRAAEQLAGVESFYTAGHMEWPHLIDNSLKAHHLYKRDVNYVVNDQGEVVIVDEFTGRLMPGRNWSDGLHQAVEAKEGVPVQRENQTLASVTFQNLFRMYNKLSGMTGTADTEAFEFQSIYGLEVIVIPTNRPTVRKDSPDQVFLNRQGKFKAVLADIQECYQRGQPVLVGTTSIETSEMLSDFLNKAGVPHEVLNAKQHEREAHIVAQAGRPGAITIATNMAGRGTDIVLGGSLEAEYETLPEDASDADRAAVKAEWQKRHDEVKASGGLHIVGTERHESRRIDNQLRGRSGRQGDPGSSRFYLSLEDNLMRIFASDWVQKAMKLIGMKEDDVIEDKLVSRQIEKAQRKVEAHNFDIRKNLLDFDDVNNDQRKVIYAQRDELLDAESVKDNIDGIRGDVVAETVARFVPLNSVDEQWDLRGLESELGEEMGAQVPVTRWREEADDLDAETIERRVQDAMDQHFADKEAVIGGETMRALEKHIMLTVLDKNWKEHLARMDYLRQGIHLRGYAQKQPKQEYKKEAFELFSSMLERVKSEVVTLLSRVRIRSEEEVAALEAQERAAAEAQARQMQFQHQDAGGYGADEEAEQARQIAATQGGYMQSGPMPAHRDAPKVGRNDPCPCGSGKKFKHCHGQLA